MKTQDIERRGGAIAMVILAVAFGIGFVTFCVATLWSAIDSGAPFFNVGGISENATQVLTGWGGGIVGILGAYVGYRAASPTVHPPEPPEVPPDSELDRPTDPPVESP